MTDDSAAATAAPVTGADGSGSKALPTLVVFISTCAGNARRRRAIRRSWFQYQRAPDSPLSAAQRASVDLVFIASKGHPELSQEAASEGDILLLDAPEGYHKLWRKALVFLQYLAARCDAGASSQQHQAQAAQQTATSGSASSHSATAAAPGCEGDGLQPPASSAPQAGWCYRRAGPPTFLMHADDDSYVRLDLLLPLMATWPRARHYWGYVWDGTGARVTAPIRDPRNKSHMPAEQYPLDYYPPFASGCGFVLSWDLALALARAAPTLPDYRLLDPPFGIHLCGPPELCILEAPVLPVHDERVRPYRPLPTFRADTLVQHYLQPEELAPFHAQALATLNSHNSSSEPADKPASNCAAAAGACTSRPASACVQGADAAAPPSPAAAAGVGGDELQQLCGGSEAALQLYNQLVALGLLRR